MSVVEYRADRAPDLIQPVLGFRQWRLGPGGSLISMHCEEAWPAGMVAARCRAGGHEDRPAPVNACSCGIYAWYRQCPRTGSTADLVAGAVVLWGSVELHVTGMRAQFCRIVALALPLSNRRKRRLVCETAERLGVPAVPHRQLALVARAHGSPVPDGLRPPRHSLTSPGQIVGVVPRLVQSTTEAASNSRHTPTGRI